MPEFTLTELVSALRASAGEDEEVDLDGDVLDVPFDDLGYDSLALFNTVGRIERERGISLSDDVVGQAATPRALISEINAAISQAA
jgi:act minimal PKS acyl carrier protein